MRTEKQHHSNLKVIKGGKHPHKTYSKKSRYYFEKREKKRQEKLEEKTNLFLANACVNTLSYMQKVARAINPAFYFERLVPNHNGLYVTLNPCPRANRNPAAS